MKAGLDIGNSRSKLGLYFDDGTIETKEIERSPEAILKSVNKYAIEELIVSSVSGDLVDDVMLMKALRHFVFLTHHTPLPIVLKYETPETLGRDRMALAVGAWSINKKRSSSWLILDAGTCITMDVLNGEGEFLGGAISPGIAMRLKAMHTFTANLPFVNLKDWEDPIGRNTEEALIRGAAQGAVCEIEGYIERLKSELEDLNVILTGGDATFISKKINSKIFLQPDLLHVGLREILKYNAE
ncbi:MAG: type III pantothenate kinase [Saprospiraceae bacterium]|nr:type III pantothenate kinase [Saprospiraceae bacterium]